MSIQLSKEIYSAILEFVPNGLLLVNKDGDIILANRQVEKMFGYRSDKLQGQKIELLLPQQFAMGHSDHKNTFLKNLQLQPMESRLNLWGRRSNGSEFPLVLSLSPAVDEGRALTIVSICDITKQKQLEEENRIRAERLNHHNIAIQELSRSQFSELETTLNTITKKSAIVLNVARFSVWLFNDDHSELICNDLYVLSKNLHEKGARLKRADFLNYFQTIRDNVTVAADDAQNSSATGDFSEIYLKPLGITSMLDVGIFSQSKLIGCVCAEHVGSQREWSDEEIAFLIAMANLVTLAIETSARRKNDEELEEHKKQLEKLVDECIADLHEQEEALYSITASIHNGIIMIDDQYRISFWNEAAETIFGWSPQEAMGQKLYNLIVPEKCSAQLHKVFHQLEQPSKGSSQSKVLEFSALRKNGEEFPVELALSTTNKMNAWHIVGIVSDISTRKKATEELRESEQKFKAIFNNSRDGILMINAETRKIHSANRAICRMLGHELAELLQLRVEDIHPEQELSQIMEIFARVAKSKEEAVPDLPIKRKDGTVFYADINTGTVEISGQKFVIASVRDISIRKKIDEQSLQHIEELARFNKLLIGREQVMIKLKREINGLLKQLGQKEKYRTEQ